MRPHHVFVDRSGRRARWFVRGCWALGGLLTAYVVLTVLALVAPAGVIGLGLGPLLPRPEAPPVAVAGGPREPLGRLLARPPAPGPTPTATPTATPQPRRRPATSTAVRRPAASPAATTAVSPAGRVPAPRGTASPAARTSPSASAPGRSASHPVPHASRTPPAHGPTGR